MMPYSPRVVGIVSLLFCLLLMPVPCGAEENEGDVLDLEDLKLQPYLYGTIGGFPSGSGGGMTLGFGGGMDWLVYEGLGLGFDVVVFGNDTFGFALASFDVSYQFISKRRRFVPFVLAGVGAGGEGGSAVTIVSLGGSVNLWTARGMAFRVAVRGRVPADGGDVNVGAEIGVTF